MKYFLITIPDDKEITFIEMMKSTRIVKKMEAVTSVGLPDKQAEISAPRSYDRDESGECCLSWEEIDQILAS